MTVHPIPANELDFDTTSQPLHCGRPMEDDGDMHACNTCNGYLKTHEMMFERDRRTGAVRLMRAPRP